MRNTGRWAILLLALAALCAAAPSLGETASDRPLLGRTVGIDPGHQRYGNYGRERIAPHSERTQYKVTAGTSGVSTKVPEYVQNLRIAFRLRAALEARGATVFMTREGHDVNLSNRQRALMCNRARCDVVLRLHCDAAGRGSTGIGVYWSPIGPAAKASAQAAAWMLPSLKRALRPKGAWIRRTRGFAGLNWSEVPSLLIEMGFMSNPEEDRRLNDPAYQERLAAAMADGVQALLAGPEAQPGAAAARTEAIKKGVASPCSAPTA